MKEFNCLLFAKRVFGSSLCFGLMILIGYFIFQSWFFIIFGYFFLVSAFIINTLVIIFFLITALLYRDKRIECFHSILIIGLNIPLAIFCMILGTSF
ncbi:MAG: hypothetical protein DI529_05575 [Chryseobacterium sp.]|nr:MAG: hypothetical protein DI529_05575 [Chryseobacterium sp.]